VTWAAVTRPSSGLGALVRGRPARAAEPVAHGDRTRPGDIAQERFGLAWLAGGGRPLCPDGGPGRRGEFAEAIATGERASESPRPRHTYSESGPAWPRYTMCATGTSPATTRVLGAGSLRSAGGWRFASATVVAASWLRLSLVWARSTRCRVGGSSRSDHGDANPGLRSLFFMSLAEAYLVLDGRRSAATGGTAWRWRAPPGERLGSLGFEGTRRLPRSRSADPEPGRTSKPATRTAGRSRCHDLSCARSSPTATSARSVLRTNEQARASKRALYERHHDISRDGHAILAKAGERGNK